MSHKEMVTALKAAAVGLAAASLSIAVGIISILPDALEKPELLKTLSPSFGQTFFSGIFAIYSFVLVSMNSNVTRWHDRAAIISATLLSLASFGLLIRAGIDIWLFISDAAK